MTQGNFEPKDPSCIGRDGEPKAPEHHKAAVRAQAREANNAPMVHVPETKEEPWQMTKGKFIEDYYKKDKKTRTIWKGKDFTESTAKIEARKLGANWTIEQSPYEKGRFIVVEEKDKIPISDYKKEYGGELAIVHKQIIKRALSEGKPVPPEVLNDYPDLIKEFNRTRGNG